MHNVQELVRLHRLGRSAREIARLLQMSRNTVRSYLEALRATGHLDGPLDSLPDPAVLRTAVPRRRPEHEVSTVASARPLVEAMLAKGATPGPIHDALRVGDADFHGSRSAVKRLCASIRRELGPRATDVVIRVETGPGEIAQVDFKYAGRVRDPQRGVVRDAWIFLMILGHSRHMFAKAVFDQKAETWQRLHVEAFAYFGGVPRIIVPDNLKAAVIRAAFHTGDEPELHRSYCELARHYGFTIDPTPPRSPEDKGKVESGARYVGENFLATLPEGLDLDDVNRRLRRWTDDVAGLRVHGTTGRQPRLAFEQDERHTLLALPAIPFRPTIWRRLKVHRDTLVAFDGRFYSVPFRHIGAEVDLRATADEVCIYVDDVLEARHDRRGKGRFSIIDAHLPAERVAHRRRDAAFWLAKAHIQGPEVAGLVEEILGLGGPINPIRRIIAIVSLFEKHPSERANNAARRARRFGLHTYGQVAEVLRLGLDFEALPPDLPLELAAPKPKFARDISSMLTPTTKDPHDWN